MSLQLDARQRAMLQEMGIALPAWPTLAEARPAHSTPHSAADAAAGGMAAPSPAPSSAAIIKTPARQASSSAAVSASHHGLEEAEEAAAVASTEVAPTTPFAPPSTGAFAFVSVNCGLIGRSVG